MRKATYFIFCLVTLLSTASCSLREDLKLIASGTIENPILRIRWARQIDKKLRYDRILLKEYELTPDGKGYRTKEETIWLVDIDYWNSPEMVVMGRQKQGIEEVKVEFQSLKPSTIYLVGASSIPTNILTLNTTKFGRGGDGVAIFTTDKSGKVIDLTSSISEKVMQEYRCDGCSLGYDDIVMMIPREWLE